MGLHNTAHYLKTKGRGDDTELVHMTKDEVHALKGLAAKHGGQLTINPETGLPEAGFLSNILPTVAGIAVGIATENPMLGAAVAGLGSYATTGSISRGLMAGISAYGGAGLGASLAETGAEAGTEAAVNAGNEAIKESANQMITSNLSAALPEGATVSAETGAQISSMKDAAVALKEGAITSEQYAQLANQFSQGYAPVMNAANTMGSGLQAITASPSALGKFAMGNISNIGMTAAPMLAGELTKRPTLPGASTAQQTNPFGLKYLSSDFKGTFPSQPNPAYVANYPNYVQNPYNPYAPVGTPTQTTPVRAAVGGLMAAPPTPGLMDGGKAGNVDFMGGDMYPTSQQSRSYYATPTQAPTSAQAAMASYEPNTNPLTGEMTANMREGGIASYGIGGFLESAVKGPMYHAQQAGNTYQQHPEQAALGINTPAEAYVWNNAMGSDYRPTVNMYGGPTQEDYAKARQEGVDMSANRVADAAAPTVMAATGLGAPFAAGMAAGNYLGNRYEISLMREEYNADPAGFTQKYGYVKGINGYAKGGIASYSGKYGSMVAATDMLQNLGMPGKADYLPKGDPGIYQDTDPNTRNLDAYSAALYKLNAKAKAAGMKPEAIAKLKPVMKLGDIEEDAEGGVVGMAAGGDTSHVYQPSYANYAQNPYVQQATMSPAQLQAATAGYMQQGIPAPIRGIAPGSVGYRIDPKLMAGTPEYQAEQDRIAAEQAAQVLPLGGPIQDYGGGKSGGLMPQDLHYAMGGFVPSLGGYAAGGNPRLLKGPGDGMSDSIPANIGGKQPARLADGEFVVPADVVSHLGNGSTDAGAKKLYGMMDKIRRARTGKKKQAPEVKADKYLPR